jgi:hypothetical protein
MDRLGWILDGLNGAAEWGSDAAEVLAPELAALVPPDVFTERVRQLAAAFAPGTVTGLDASGHTARVRVRVRDGTVQLVSCTVEPAAPHRIRQTTTMPLIPSFLAPRLPADFTGCEELAGCGAGARLIVFSGLPGTGKSTLAEAAGRQLCVPVFAVDWLLGSLTPFGGYHLDELLEVGAELLTALAFRQLELGQSRSWTSLPKTPPPGTGGGASRVPQGQGSGSSSAPAPTRSCTGPGWNPGNAASLAGTRAATGPTLNGGSRSSRHGPTRC